VTHWFFAGGVGILMALVAIGTVRSGQLLRTWTPPGNLLLSPPDNGLRIALIAVGLGLGYTLGPGPAMLGWRTDYLRQDLLWGALLGVALAVGLGLAGQIVARRWGEAVYSTRMLQCILPTNGREWVGVLLALLPAAALEELLFRALPLGGLAWLIPPYWLLWPLALAFGLLHWPQGGWGVVGTTLAGIALSLLFLATGGIWAPLAAHYVLNVSQLLLAKRTGLQPLRRGAECSP